ncbi:MAG: flagellar biosynthesis protein FlhB [Nitrospinota bacterium]
MAEDKDQKTEEPTDKKREDSFSKGRTATSKEVTSTFVLLTAISMLYGTSGWMYENILKFMSYGFSQSASYEISVSSMRPLVIYYAKATFFIVGPIMAAVTIVSIITIMAQNGGFILTLDPMMPKWAKLNPIKGVSRMFSKTAVMELFKSLSKIGIFSYIVYKVIMSEWENIPRLSDQSVEHIIWFIGLVSLKLVFYILLFMIVVSVIDFAFQKYQFKENLMMTKQEVKDERKETEGDPIIKQRIRQTQMQMARRRMMAEVPKADVVITNPTHLAVALAYDRAKMGAPTVIAKGAGLVAQKIKEIARENDVPLMEDKPLARILFKTIAIGQSIPEELFKAIAEILAYVYKLKGNGK